MEEMEKRYRMIKKVLWIILIANFAVSIAKIIIGYITKGSGITVHRTNCKNIIDVDERLVNVKWNVTEKKYETDLLIYTNNTDNLVEIITKASSNNITIDSIKAINKSDYKLYDMTVLVENNEILRKFLIDLENLPFVLRVERMIN